MDSPETHVLEDIDAGMRQCKCFRRGDTFSITSGIVEYFQRLAYRVTLGNANSSKNHIRTRSAKYSADLLCHILDSVKLSNVRSVKFEYEKGTLNPWTIARKLGTCWKAGNLKCPLARNFGPFRVLWSTLRYEMYFGPFFGAKIS